MCELTISWVGHPLAHPNAQDVGDLKMRIGSESRPKNPPFRYDVIYVTSYMAIGESGRVVLEIDPEFKREFYGTLTRDGKTLKQWFLKEAKRYLDERNQPSLFEHDAENAVSEE